ncbi:hypothetical protein BT93_B0593 [Corymbia citriodora subsp. variegata]|nr:hypothetical protein BT93_B0593 [Corymbia citriodora subsp. variegata]
MQDLRSSEDKIRFGLNDVEFGIWSDSVSFLSSLHIDSVLHRLSPHHSQAKNAVVQCSLLPSLAHHQTIRPSVASHPPSITPLRREKTLNHHQPRTTIVLPRTAIDNHHASLAIFPKASPDRAQLETLAATINPHRSPIS